MVSFDGLERLARRVRRALPAAPAKRYGSPVAAAAFPALAIEGPSLTLLLVGDIRSAAGRIADSLGMRPRLAGLRDDLVGVLTGDGADRVARRNRMDDRSLRLLIGLSLPRDANCLDVGAHMGTFLRQFRRVAPEGHHIAYEPLPECFEKLVAEYPGVDVRPAALSDHNGEASFVRVVGGSGYSGLLERRLPAGVSTETIRVRVERLDDDLPEGWLPDFVKIDVEGGEVDVLRGGSRTLRQAEPIVAFEHGCRGSEHYGATDEELFRLVHEQIGLRLFDLDGNGPLGLGQFLEELESGERWNWVAHP